MWWDGPWYGFHSWMWVFPLLFFILFALLVFRGAKWCGPMRHAREESAREILDRRYARGEIGADEYQRMRKDLQ